MEIGQLQRWMALPADAEAAVAPEQAEHAMQRVLLPLLHVTQHVLQRHGANQYLAGFGPGVWRAVVVLPLLPVCLVPLLLQLQAMEGCPPAC